MPPRRRPPKPETGGQDRFRLILQNIRDFAIFSADLKGLINEWNPGAERFFGYSEEEILGQPMELLYVPEDRAAGRAEMEKAQAAQTGFSEDERWHLKKDGTRFFVNGVVNAMYDDSRRLCGFIKVARDITPRRILQERLAASEAEHRHILEAIKDFAIVTMDLRGIIRTWNPGAALTFGFDPEEIVGKSHERLFTADDCGKGEPERRLSEALREGISQGECWLKRKDGSRVFVIDVIRPMISETGQPYAILRVSRDITSRHMTRLKLEATQKELEEIRAELEQKVAHRTAAQEKTVRSLEEVLYHVAHDLRAPLRSMEGFSSILVQKYASAGDPEARRLTDYISGSARRMDQLIQDLLTYGRLCHEPVLKQKVDLQRVIDTARTKLEKEIREAGAEIKVTGPMPAICGDSNVLAQALCQLLSNALTFVVAGRKPQVEIRSQQVTNGRLRLWIQDNGVGIAPEYLDRIFWLFERLSQQESPSTGMGLAIAKKAIERLEGAIGVESTPGTGSRFWIELSLFEKRCCEP